jgi:hypothetical protein
VLPRFDRGQSLGGPLVEALEEGIHSRFCAEGSKARASRYLERARPRAILLARSIAPFAPAGAALCAQFLHHNPARSSQ